jgi:hypothetical protein
MFVVCFELKWPNTAEDYSTIVEAIQGYGAWMRMGETTWFLESPDSEDTAARIRDHLKNYLHPADAIFVAQVGGSWAFDNVSNDRAAWIRERFAP